MVACIASVSVWFRSKERPRNGILGFGRARNETRATPLFYLRHLTLVPRSLLLNRTETLAMQAGHAWPFRIVRSDRQWYWVPHSVVRRHNNQRDEVVAWVLSPREERVGKVGRNGPSPFHLLPLPSPRARYIICFSIKLFLMQWIIAFFSPHKGCFLYDVVTYWYYLCCDPGMN